MKKIFRIEDNRDIAEVVVEVDTGFNKEGVGLIDFAKDFAEFYSDIYIDFEDDWLSDYLRYYAQSMTVASSTLQTTNVERLMANFNDSEAYTYFNGEYGIRLIEFHFDLPDEGDFNVSECSEFK